MEGTDRELRLLVVGTDAAALSRATGTVEELGRSRSVDGAAPEWGVLYPYVPVAEALALCEQDLSEIDPM